MFLDWSGSMVDNIDYTMKQLLLYGSVNVLNSISSSGITDRMKNH